MVAFAVFLQLVKGWFAPVPSGTVGFVHVTLTTGSPVRSQDDGITPRVSEPARVKETLDNYCLLFRPLVRLAFADPVYHLRGNRYPCGLSLYTNGIPPTPKSYGNAVQVLCSLRLSRTYSVAPPPVYGRYLSVTLKEC